jgi:hypothetical protein
MLGRNTAPGVDAWAADRFERLAREAERQAVLRSGIATMVKERTPSKPHTPPSLARPDPR